jgi:hypothetical protein
MVATDVASRGIGMIKHNFPFPFPSISFPAVSLPIDVV